MTPTPADVHFQATALAVRLQGESKQRYDSVSNDIVRDALFALSHDAIRLHRAVGELVERGWSAEGAVLLRTMLDLNVSVLAILNSPVPRLAAFKYFYSGFRRIYRDPGYPAEVRRANREQVRDRLKTLSSHDRKAAIEAFKDKDRPYWFCPEWSGPSEVVTEFGTADMAWVYAQLSAAAHGGFLGLRLYSDSPDRMDINPRLPVGRRAERLLLSAARFLLELLQLRDGYERLGMDEELGALRDVTNALALGRSR